MKYNMTKFDKVEDYFTVGFEKETTTERTKVTVEVKLPWKHRNTLFSNYEGELDSFRGITVIDDGQASGFSAQYASELYKDVLRNYTIAIPDAGIRDMFQQVLLTWSKYVNCPLDVKPLDHTQFPLTQILFNKQMICAEEVESAVRSILDSLTFCETKVEKIEIVKDTNEEDEEFSGEVFDYPIDNMDEFQRTMDANKTIEDEDEDAYDVGEVVEDEEPFDVGEVVEEETR